MLEVGVFAGVFRPLEGAERQLVHVVNHLRIGAGRGLQSRPWNGLRRLPIGVEVIVILAGVDRRRADGGHDP